MSKYRTCDRCGSNLDHGEKCDCENERIDQQWRTSAINADITRIPPYAIRIAAGATVQANMKGVIR